jgi:hypothetical protein
MPLFDPEHLDLQTLPEHATREACNDLEILDDDQSERDIGRLVGQLWMLGADESLKTAGDRRSLINRRHLDIAWYHSFSLKGHLASLPFPLHTAARRYCYRTDTMSYRIGSSATFLPTFGARVSF